MESPKVQQDMEAGAKVESSTVQQDAQTGAKSLSTPEMMKLFALSTGAGVLQVIAFLGWVTLKIDVGLPAEAAAAAGAAAAGMRKGGFELPEVPALQIGFIGMDPPITSMIFFAMLFSLPVAIAAPFSMFTHWKPESVLLGSQQLTDSLRGLVAAPYHMKRLYVVMACMNGIGLLSLGYSFFWPLVLNIINIGLYAAGFALVLEHFKNPDVPIRATTDVGRIDALEQEVKHLKQELSALRNQLSAK